MNITRLGYFLIPFLGLGCGQSPQPAPPVAAAPATNAVAPAVPAPPAKDDVNEAVWQEALELKARGKLAEARDLLLPFATANAADRLVVLLSEINTQIIFTPAPAPEKVDHTIAAGDTLGKLAKQHGTTVELIQRANGLRGDKIRVGDRLRIYRGTFRVEVSKGANTLTLWDGERFFKRYRVGTGQYSKTPVGEFRITSRIADPPWYRANGDPIPFGHPDNILGTHWLGLDSPGYGLHGTWETNSIGQQSSAGCVRLLNSDVAELYVLLPVGTPVTIRD